MGRLFDTRLYRADDGVDGHPRVAEILATRAAVGGARASAGADRFLAALGDALADDPGLPLGALIRVARALDDDPGLDELARVGFWADLVQRIPENPAVAACHGDALLEAERDPEAVQALLAAIERDPGMLGDLHEDIAALAREQGGEQWLRYELAELHAVLDRLARQSDSDSDLAAGIRERYSELLEEHDHDEAALARIRALGQRIRQLEDLGVLPRTFMRRGSWRRDSR